MAIRSKTSFVSAYLSVTGVYKDNIVGDIHPDTLRDGFQDTWDSYTAQDTTMAANIATVSGVAATNTINIATASGVGATNAANILVNSGNIAINSGNIISTISGLVDVAISSPVNGSILQYNSTSGVWDNTNALDPSGNIATSFFVVSWAADTFTAKPKNVFGTIYSDAAFTGQTITSAQSRTITQGYNRHPVLNVTTLTTSGVVRISGNKINENTGVVTSGYTEDLTVTATGYYQGAGKYVDTITFGGTGDTTASVTATAYTTTYADFGNSHFGLKYVRFGWIPSNPAWDIALRVYQVHEDGSLTSLDQGRLAFNSTDNANRAANGVVGHAKIIQADNALIDIRGDQNEGIVIEITDKAGTGLPSNIASASFYIGLRKYFS